MLRHQLPASELLLPAYFPGTLYRLLLADGLDPRPLLEDSGLKADRFNDDTFRLSLTQHQHFLSCALALTADPHLGIRLGNSLNVTSLGILGYAAMSSATLGSALETISHYFSIRAPLLRVTLHREAEQVYLQIDESLELGETRYFMLSAALSGALKLLKLLTQIDQLEVSADIACDCPVGSADAFGFPVVARSRQTRLYFTAALLNRTLAQADPQTAQSSMAICERLLEAQQPISSLPQRLRLYLREQPHGLPSLDEAARQFRVSSRTLRRALQQSGTSFQQELALTKCEIAFSLLLQSSKSIEQIALALGYSDLPNFGRAFRKWTGQSPSQYRNGKLGRSR